MRSANQVHTLRKVVRLFFCALLLHSSSTARAEPNAEAQPSAAPTTAGTPSRSPSAPPLVWKWPTFRVSEYVVTGVVGAAAIGVFTLGSPRESPRWTGGILFDDSLRDLLRVRSPGARERVRTLSDITGITSVMLAVGIDSIFVPAWRQSPRVVLQLLLLDAEAFALNGLLTSSTLYVAGRARPSYADCQRDPRFDPLCNPRDTASFWSGHTALAFTAAGLSCAHHAYVKLYGGGAADTLACAGAIGLSATTGTLRLLGDRHYASDVFTGALVGFGIGYATPTLLHYTQGAGEVRRVGFSVAPMGRGIAVAAVGSF